MPGVGDMTTIGVQGLDELKEMLGELGPREANNVLRAAVHALAIKGRTALRKNVKVDSGQLRKSIKAVRRNPKGGEYVSEVRLGHSAPYGIMLEFGTKNTTAQPFIVPTTEQLRPTIPNHFREEFGKKYEKALHKLWRKTIL